MTDYLLYIDSRSGLVRRVGRRPPRGRLEWIEVTDPIDRHGLRWPTRFSLWSVGVDAVREPSWRWRLSGLDIDRLYGPDQLRLPGPPTGRAAPPPAALGESWPGNTR